MMVAIITGYGINAEKELATAFELAGAMPKFLHLNDLIEAPEILSDAKIIAFPGGFSFGDHIGSGTILAHVVRNHLKSVLQRHINAGGLVIGICNGFQTLVKMGILPNTAGNWTNEVSLIHNSSGCFIDKWVGLKTNSYNISPWLQDMDEFDCPIRHGEGQFIPGDVLFESFPRELIAFQYSENPNGSYMDIAGITDPSGQVLGMMPHPEAFIHSEQHPAAQSDIEAAGLKLFRNAVNYAGKL